MKILKRNGTFENLSFDKILHRIRKLCNDTSLGILSTIDPDLIAQKTVTSIYDGVSSSELDEEAARIAVGMIENLEYPILASRLVISNIQKNTKGLFSDIMERLYSNITNDKHAPIITEEGIKIIRKYKDILNTSIDYSRDYLFDYFGYKTFEKGYLLKINEKVVECPQHLYMRVAIQVHKEDISNVLKTYNYISQHYFTFASPTMFNSLTPMNNLSSCFDENTVITTVNRGPVLIKNIKKGDKVTTHLGNVKKVLQIHKNKLNNRKLYEIQIGNDFVKVTDNHEIYTENGLKTVEELTKDDLVKVSIKNKTYKYIQEYDIEFPYITDLFAKFIGSYYVNGFVSNNCLCINTESLTEQDIYFYKQINFYLGIHVVITESCFAYKSNHLSNLFEKYFGVYDSKKIWSEMYKWDFSLIKSFVEGINISDNIVLPLDIIKFLNNNGYFNITGLKYEKQSFINILHKKLITNNLPEYVYTLGIENDHSYNVSGICVKNCFLLGTQDSIEGIFKTIGDTAKISKVGGGIGIHVHNIRSKGSRIKGTNGYSDGIIPMLKVYNSTSNFVNQCFTPDTWVYSLNGPKQMHKITTDDSLITIDGTFKKVNEVIKNNVDKEILEITSMHTLFPVKVTKEHEIFVLKNISKIINYSTIIENLESLNIKPEFFNANELTENDIVGYPIPTYTCDNDINDLNYYKSYGNLLLNNKDIIKEEYLHLPKNKIMKIIEGLTNNKTMSFTTNSNILIMQLKYILLRCNILTSVSINHLGDYYLQILNNTNDYFEWNGVLWSRIKSISKIQYSGEVYDFNMIDNHNYLTDMGLVHNSGKRKGSFAIYLDPGHPDIFEFLDLKKNTGSEDQRARDLFLAMWIPDLFMKKVKNNEDWYLMCPEECPGLNDVYGEDYEKLYQSYIDKKLYKKKVKALDVWTKILDSQIETGTPYMLYKDSSNKKSNQKNIGVIKSSNLCSEILLYSDEKEYAVCFTGDTKILTESGYKRIDECDNEKVFSYYNSDIDFKENSSFTKAKLINNGLAEVFEMMCENGKFVKATLDHLFLTQDEINGYQWKKFVSLQNSDNIIVYNQNTKRHEKTKMLYKIYKGLEQVYDLNVPEKYHYIAESFIVHNCNLASVALSKFVEYDSNNKPYFNHQKLFQVTKDMVLPMNNVIDYNFYPTVETKYSNFKNRPIGIGIQSLHFCYIMMGYPFESKEAHKLNVEIFETMYFAALSGSLELAKKDGVYSTYYGSPLSEGKFQFDLWKEYDNIKIDEYISKRWDWESLRKDIMIHGVRNSTLLTCMPTASSAQIMGNSDTIEPIDSCIYKKRTISGEYIVANKHLIKELTKLGLWNKNMKDKIIINNGSIQNILEIPDNIKQLFKTVWEMSMKSIINQSRERAFFICQTQSLNISMENPNYNKLTSMHFYGWSQGLKTGMYYLRQKTISAGKFNVNPELEKQSRENKKEQESEEECLMCSA